MAETNSSRSKREPDDCDGPEVRDLASEYLERDLDNETFSKVAAHLDWCPPCSAFIDTLGITVGLLRSSGWLYAPASLRERLRDQLSLEERR